METGQTQLPEHVLPYGKRRVVDGEEVFVVFQQAQVQFLDKAACGKDHAEVADLRPVRGVVDCVDAHLYEVLLGKLEVVGPLQAWQPVEAGPEVVVVVEAERRLLGTILGQALEVRDGLDAEVAAVFLARSYGVGVVARRGVEPPYAVLIKVFPGHRLVLLFRVWYRVGPREVDEPAGRRVLSVEVDLARLQRLAHGLVAPEDLPVYCRSVGGLEDLDGDVAERFLLGKTLLADGELGALLRPAQPELVTGDLRPAPARAFPAATRNQARRDDDQKEQGEDAPRVRSCLTVPPFPASRSRAVCCSPEAVPRRRRPVSGPGLPQTAFFLLVAWAGRLRFRAGPSRAGGCRKLRT